jgi:hypothetical protein
MKGKRMRRRVTITVLTALAATASAVAQGLPAAELDSPRRRARYLVSSGLAVSSLAGVDYYHGL